MPVGFKSAMVRYTLKAMNPEAIRVRQAVTG